MSDVADWLPSLFPKSRLSSSIREIFLLAGWMLLSD
jgi:hypothetical protein